MSDVTRILSAIEQGRPGAAAELLPLIYDELRTLAAQKMAHEHPGQTLQPTALIHAAEVMDISRRTADRYWAYASAWLCDALSDNEPAS